MLVIFWEKQLLKLEEFSLSSVDVGSWKLEKEEASCFVNVWVLDLMDFNDG